MDPSRTVRVTKRFHFELAHALRCHDGLCAHVHGHGYVLDVTLVGMPAVAPGTAKDGMVMDFADLKALVNAAVISRYDHALVLHEKEAGSFSREAPLFGRTLLTPWQPTCENLLLDIVGRLREALPPEVTLAAVRLQETATSWAEWAA